MYTYLAGHVGHDGDEGAFRALTRGYQRWASGRIEEIRTSKHKPSRVLCMLYHETLHEDGPLQCVSTSCS